MFPKHKIDHENIVDMGTTVNYIKEIMKKTLVVGCLLIDPTEKIKSAEILNLEQRMHQIGKSWNKIKNVAAMPSKQTSTEEMNMKSQQLKI